MNPADKVEIVKITPITTGGSLRAFVSVRIGALTVHDFRVIKQADQRAWVSRHRRKQKIKMVVESFGPWSSSRNL